jgi:hypothetical protein
MEGIQSDIVQEAHRIADSAVSGDVLLRLIGGLAIRLHAGDDLPAVLIRSYADIDLVTTSKGSKRALKLLEDLGYVANDRFNAMNAGRRAVVYDLQHQRQVDLFIGEFRMCHKIDLASRIDVDPRTVPLAELLLTKLQIVELNRKDLIDIAALLHEHDIDVTDDDAINVRQIARLLASDWGLWRTCRGTKDSVLEHLGELGLDVAGEQRVRDRLVRLWLQVEEEPKSLRWRSRARIGERTRWYEEPEEVAHDRTGAHL